MIITHETNSYNCSRNLIGLSVHTITPHQALLKTKQAVKLPPKKIKIPHNVEKEAKRLVRSVNVESPFLSSHPSRKRVYKKKKTQREQPNVSNCYWENFVETLEKS